MTGPTAGAGPAAEHAGGSGGVDGTRGARGTADSVDGTGAAHGDHDGGRNAVDGTGVTAAVIRVLVADDQPLVRAGVSALLDAEPDIEVVAVAADGGAALELARSTRPDVAVLDIRMPVRNGIEVARELCGPDADPAVPALMLTTFDMDDLVFGALEAGASGFLLKDAEPDVIIGAVRQVAAGNGTLDQTLTRRVLREFASRRSLQPVTGDRADGVLTARERDVLLLLAQGMSNEEIAAELVVEVSTVKSHLARMLPKLGVRSRLQAVVWAYQNRIVAVPGP